MYIDPKIIELLEKRGITGPEELKEFFSDKPKETYDPFLLPDMEEGVDLILSCIDEGKKICIYGDYDCDGVTSTVIMAEILSELTDRSNIMEYIPSRFDEGYGLNASALDTIKERGAGLVITVDCGSVSVDEVRHAKEIGLDIVVTDHHRIEDKMAEGIVINPAREDSEYPFRYLAGCGVAFKLGQALSDAAGLEKHVITSKLDLVALGTIGDIVPLLSENRMLTKYGLRAINTSNREALRVLIEKVGLTPGKITAENVSYILVPHINAAGRMRSAGLALKLFLAKDRSDMERYADELIACNRERKNLQEEVFQEACGEVEDKYKDDDFIVAYLKNAHEGVAGIAAGKLKEKYHVPSVIVTDTEDGMLKGTGRSPEGVDLYNLLKNEEKWFTAFGGHAAACGFTMKKDGLEEMRTDLNRLAGEVRTESPEAFMESEKSDLDLSGAEANIDFVSQLEMLEPCGCKNERPQVSVIGIPDNISRMGAEGKFLRFTLRDGKSVLSCVAFSSVDEIEAKLRDSADSGTGIRVIGSLGRHEWNGNVSVQMNVRTCVTKADDPKRNV